MKNALALARKDFLSYFQSWLGTFLFVFFFLIAGIFFSVLVINFSKISLDAQRTAFEGVQGLGQTRFIFSSFFLNMGSMLMFFVPLLSMRALAEERRHETLELLYTYPLSDFEIIWGKFLGMIWFFEVLFLPIVAFVPLLMVLGGDVEWATVAVGFLGFWMLGSAYLSLGLFVSSLTDSPVLAALITFGMLTVFWILDWVTGVADGTLAHVLTMISPLGHYREFCFGIFDLSHAAYFLFFHLYFLFLSLRSVEIRNWKG